MYLPALAVAAAGPLFCAVLFVPDPNAAFALLALPFFLTGLIGGPQFATALSVVRADMRGTASAILLLVINVISGLFGAQVIGLLSDGLASEGSARSLQLSLAIVALFGAAWAATHFYLASATIDADMDRAI
jgi:hypothetical protein